MSLLPATPVATSSHVLALRALLALHRMLLQPMGSRSLILGPADGHTAVGLSFTGLVGLVSALAVCLSSLCRAPKAAFDGRSGIDYAMGRRV